MPAHIKLVASPKHEFHRLVGSLVGEAAEKVLLGIRRDPATETQDVLDARQAATAISRYGWFDVLTRAKDAAETFVRANRTQIEALSRFLYRAGTLNGIEIELLLQRHLPLSAVPSASPAPRSAPRSIESASDRVYVRDDGFLVPPKSEHATRAIAASGIANDWEPDERKAAR